MNHRRPIGCADEGSASFLEIAKKSFKHDDALETSVIKSKIKRYVVMVFPGGPNADVNIFILEKNSRTCNISDRL